MGLRLHQSFEIFPGVRLNFNGGGITATFGVPSASINIGRHGIRSTVGIPPDRRFRDNYQIPVCLYRKALFTNRGGVEEEYQSSDMEAATNFGRAFEAFKPALAA